MVGRRSIPTCQPARWRGFIAAMMWMVAVAIPLLVGGEMAVAKPSAPPPPWERGMDSTALARAFEQRGFSPGPDFKAVVVEVTRAEAGGLGFQWYDYRGTGKERDSWWPASTVKLPMAVAALERLRGWGFSPAATVTFRYERGPVTESVKQLVERALIPSDNHAYDMLGEIVGFDHLNKAFLTAKKGFWTAVLQRGYSGRVKDKATRRGSLRHSSAMLIEQGDKAKEIEERMSHKSYDCPNHGNCMTLTELAETMRRVMFHEALPRAERFDLGKAELRVLRDALAAKRPRGLGVVDGIRAGFGDSVVSIAHKPGFALDWFSDVVYVREEATKREWIVAMANQPGREACDEAARQMGAILREGALAGSREGVSVALPASGAAGPMTEPSSPTP